MRKADAATIVHKVREAGGMVCVTAEGRISVSPVEIGKVFLTALQGSKLEILRFLIEEQTQPAGSMAVLDSDAWEDDVKAWARDRCVSRRGKNDCGNLATLLSDCANWCIARDVIPPTSAVLESILAAGGFPTIGGMVRGLILREDLAAVLEAMQHEHVLAA